MDVPAAGQTHLQVAADLLERGDLGPEIKALAGADGQGLQFAGRNAVLGAGGEGAENISMTAQNSRTALGGIIIGNIVELAPGNRPQVFRVHLIEAAGAHSRPVQLTGMLLGIGEQLLDGVKGRICRNGNAQRVIHKAAKIGKLLVVILVELAGHKAGGHHLRGMHEQGIAISVAGVLHVLDGGRRVTGRVLDHDSPAKHIMQTGRDRAGGQVVLTARRKRDDDGNGLFRIVVSLCAIGRIVLGVATGYQ